MDFKHFASNPPAQQAKPMGLWNPRAAEEDLLSKTIAIQAQKQAHHQPTSSSSKNHFQLFSNKLYHSVSFLCICRGSIESWYDR
jgi:hypothetical protein